MVLKNTYTIGVDECSLSMELTLIKLALIDNTIWESEFSFALLPAVYAGTLIS